MANFCSECGATLTGSKRFCSECGTPFKQSTSHSETLGEFTVGTLPVEVLRTLAARPETAARLFAAQHASTPEAEVCLRFGQARDAAGKHVWNGRPQPLVSRPKHSRI